MSTQAVSVGRVVHYVVPSGKHRPALVVDERDGQAIALVVFALIEDEIGAVITVDPCPYDADGSRGTWHWPEQVGKPISKKTKDAAED